MYLCTGFKIEHHGPGRFPVKKQTMKQNYNKHEIAMLGLIREEIDILVGGYENQMMDSPVDSKDYKDAYNYLYETPAKDLLEEFYDLVMARCKAGSNAEHARFAGSAFLRAKLGLYIIKNGLGKEFHIVK